MSKRDGVIGDGSHAAIKTHSLGLKHTSGPSFSEDMPAVPAGHRDRASHVAPSNRKMQRHERTGEPIYANSPEPRPAKIRGMRHFPVEHDEK